MLTVRLPDLTSPAAPRPGRSKPVTDRPELIAKTSTVLPEIEHSVTERTAPLGILSRIYQFVGQPKFWLAGITAIGVQVVLALVFTPAPTTSDPAPSPRSKAPAVPERAPAARIVVPPAESPSAKGAVPSADLLTAPQMQPAPPADASTQVEPLPSTSAAPVEDAAARSRPAPAPRVAEQRRLAEERRYDGQAAEAAGATLDAVVPIDDVELEQPPLGIR